MSIIQAIPFEPFRDEILAFYRTCRAKATWAKARQAFREIEALEPRTTADLTPGLVARFVESRRGRGDASTIGLLNCLRVACRYATRMGWLAVSPFAVVADWGLDAEPRDIPRHLSMAEVARLLEHVEAGRESWTGGRLQALVATLAYTGLRRGEALHLRAEDIDLERGFLWVPKRRLAWKAKTSRSAAPVPIPTPLAPILADWIPRSESPWLFPGVTRIGPWTGGAPGWRPYDALAAAGKAAGVGHVNFMVLRHTWATHAPSWGLGEIQVKQVLRHTTIRTQRHYIHADLENLRRAVRRIDYRLGA